MIEASDLFAAFPDDAALDRLARACEALDAWDEAEDDEARAEAAWWFLL